MAFKYEPPSTNPYSQSIAQLMEQQGDIQAKRAIDVAAAEARAQEISGQAWGQAASNIGQTVGQTIQAATSPQAQMAKLQLSEAQQKKADLVALDNAYKQPGGRDAVLNALPGHLKPTVAKAFDEQDKLHAEAQEAQGKADALKTDAFGDLAANVAAHGNDPMAAQLALSDASVRYANDPSTLGQIQQFQKALHDNPTVETVKSMTDGLINASPKRVELMQKSQQMAVTIADLNEKTRHDQEAERIAALRAQKTAQPEAGSFGDYLLKAVGPNPTGQQVLQARKEYEAAGARPTAVLAGMNQLYAETDPKAIADQIRQGAMPPDISQYGRAVQGAVASMLAKPGSNGEPPFNLSDAQRTWKAQINLNRTMNGSQQVRLDESIRSGLAMYDKVDELADQWDSQGWGPLSRANLTAARNGALGPDAAKIAIQLTGQIAQLTSDVATIEQGGLTPTNESRAVAEKSLQDWWSKGTIKAMTAQGRANMQIRELARRTQTIQTPGNVEDVHPAQPAAPSGAAIQRPIPGIEGGIAESKDGGKTWIRVK